MKRSSFLLLASAFILFGCAEENDLGKSVFKFDPNEQGLPEYSEWGYNTFGAYFDRQVFISNEQRVPAKVFVKGDTTSLFLSGQKGVAVSYYYDGEYHIENPVDMTITFELLGFSPKKYTDLIALDDSLFNFEDSNCRLKITIDTNQYTIQPFEGQIFFKRVQSLRVDDETVEAIVSGYFDFKVLIDGTPVTISEGRFDLGIGNENFYVFRQ